MSLYNHNFLPLNQLEDNMVTKKNSKNRVGDFYQAQKNKVLSKEFYERKFPFITFAKNYKWNFIFGDVLAGLTTAVTLIPVVLGFATLSDLPLQYGLYSSMLPGIIYALLGRCPEVSTAIGPTAVLALMSLNYAGNNIAYASTLCLLSGIVLFVGGLFNLGSLVNLVSLPVVSGFTSAVCILVASSQIKGLLGLKVQGHGFLSTWKLVFNNYDQISGVDASVGLGSMSVLILLRNLKCFCCSSLSQSSSLKALLSQLSWMISISRNFLVLSLTSIIAYLVNVTFESSHPLLITGDIPSGIPKLELPWKIGNSSSLQFVEIVSELGSGIFLMPLVAYLQHISIVQFYTSLSVDKFVDASQEMIALGSILISSSFLGSLVGTASITRTAVNASSGVNTTYAGFVTALIIILSCLFLTPLLAYIPKASLSAVIISAILFTMDFKILYSLWKAKKTDLIPYSLTFLLCLFWRVEFGLVIGSLVHLIMLSYFITKPRLEFHLTSTAANESRYILLKPDRGLFFPSTAQLGSEIKGLMTSYIHVKDFILDMSSVSDVDYSAAQKLQNISESMKKLNKNVIFIGLTETVLIVFHGIQWTSFSHFKNVQEAELSLQSME